MPSKKGFSFRGGTEPHHHVNNVVYTKIAFINGVELTAFIDLGSERTLLGEKVARRLGLAIKNDASILKGFGGGECKALGIITTTIQIDGFANEIRILVVPDSVMRYDLLVGDDYFCKKGVSVVKTSNTITIRYEDPRIMNVEEEKRHPIKIPLTIDDLVVELSTAANIKSKLVDLVNRYRKCFGTNSSELGYTEIETMHISLKEGKVVRHVPYRVAYGQ